MTQATDTDIRDLTNLIINLDKKIDKLDSKIDNIEIKIDARISKLETKLDRDLRELRSDIKALDIKFDERTKLSFWGFILRGLVLTALIGVGTYLLPVIAEYVHKLPSL
jgi:hypothetical protein